MDKEVYWIVSHNSRIQCLLNEILNLPAGTGKIRLKNCAVIRIEFSDKIKIQMVYSGELEEKEKHKIFDSPYYVSPNDFQLEKHSPEGLLTNPYDFRGELRDEDPHYRPPVGGANWSNPFSRPKPVVPEVKVSLEQALDYTIDKSGGEVKVDLVVPILNRLLLKKLSKLKVEQLEIEETKGEVPKITPVVFYIIRHGQALHNKTKFSPQTDTELTLEGQMQAHKAGEALLSIMEERGEVPKLLCVSDLKRTRQTLHHIIMQAMLIADRQKRWASLLPQLKLLDKQAFVVLPCASEISQVAEDGKCDQKNADAKFYKKMGLENYPKCTAAMISSNSAECVLETSHPVIWNYYLQFYGKAVRSERFETMNRYLSGTTRQHCRDTNMLANVFHFLDFLNTDLARGMINPFTPILVARQPESYSGRGTRKKRKTRRRKTRLKRII